MRTKTKNYALTGLLVLAVGISATACTGTGEPATKATANSSAPQDTTSSSPAGPTTSAAPSSPSTPSPSMTPSPLSSANTPTASPTAEPAPPTPSVGGVLVQHPYGPFIQVPLPEDDKAYDVAAPSFVSTPDLGRTFPTDVFTPEEIASAQKAVSDFIASEGVNSVLNNAAALPPQELAALRDAWWNEHAPLFAPDQQEKFKINLSGEWPPIQMEGWQKDAPTYRYLYGEDAPRVRDLNIKTQQVWAGPGPSLTFVVAVAYTTDVVLDGATLPLPQMSYGNMSYTVVADGGDSWLISDYGVGVTVEMTTVPASTTTSRERTEAETFVEALNRTTPV